MRTNVGPLLLILSLFIFSCNYSFVSIDFPPEVKTWKLDFIEQETNYRIIGLEQKINDEFHLRIPAVLKLKYDNDHPDITISGSIIQSTVSPVSISNNDQSQQNRIRLTFKGKVDCPKCVPDHNEQTITAFYDFSSEMSAREIEDVASDKLSREIVADFIRQVFDRF